ncbi:uncharacterized protein LOC108094476 isoform X1 [Drosophila ficusphila]|uniref:uncharacterized protein LOC108094476 isoform X1 n=1 Tax=Drosophila ficusphila TaxID=30025 RepID=UPI0007E899A5|nr:uncharacterized protein LOC108094476 isoform X1 [Drosophila ficusphila]
MRILFCLGILLIAGCRSETVFDRIGDGYYFIGNEKSATHFFDWFVARSDCWKRMANLVSVETKEELSLLERYIVSKGFPNGSTFATSGHSFKSAFPYSWEAVDSPLTFTRWLPGTEVQVERTYLSLQLANSSLYMRKSYGYDDYYICEYHFSPWQIWLSLESSTRIIVFFGGFAVWTIALVLFILRKLHRSSSRQKNDKVSLLEKV